MKTLNAGGTPTSAELDTTLNGLRQAQASARGEEHYLPGTVIAGRYRIVALLGAGGMGEVYRADDLTLGQPVALKLLPWDVSADPSRVALFRSEVRLARQVSHPNVCRIYDIGEADGRHFLSMEYVDGEDLASLLRRIGRVPPDKGLEIARQLCAGLAAVHARGVVHSDLKPANVMIDGRGNVRLADFGLASAPGAHEALSSFAGTPAYMAPERFEGKPATIASDIYALGLVVYEVLSGRPAFEGSTVGELAQRHKTDPPASLRKTVADIDPGLERAVEQCLEKDPTARPPSVGAIAASLPGGDPLQAALARGETPSPEMVAASRDPGSLTVRAGLALMAALAVSLAIDVAVSPRHQVPLIVPLPKPPDVLRDRAATIIRSLGYPDEPVDTSSGFQPSEWATEHGRTPRSADELRRAAALERPAALVFWYRQAPQPLTSRYFFHQGRVTPADPPLTTPGMVSVRLDPQGRLLRLVAVPLRRDGIPDPGRSFVNWGPVFQEAGLELARFTPVDSRWFPPVFAESRAAWEGTYPERGDVPIRIEAASAQGRVVFFRIVEPWTREPGAPRPRTGRVERVVTVLVPAVALMVIGGGVALALRNLRSGRGDRRGASRIAVAVLLITLADGALGADHHSDAQATMLLLLQLGAMALLVSCLVWILYLALEPYVRRRWPHLLVSWTRFVNGRFEDPLVARHLLLGTVLGASLSAVSTLLLDPHDTALITDPWWLDGARFTGSWILGHFMLSVLNSLGILLLLFLITLVTRRAWIAGVLLALLLILASARSAGGAMGIEAAALLWVLVLGSLRLGVLVVVGTTFWGSLLQDIPPTLDTSVWFWPTSLFVMAALVAVALYAFHRATGGRAILGAVLDA